MTGGGGGFVTAASVSTPATSVTHVLPYSVKNNSCPESNNCLCKCAAGNETRRCDWRYGSGRSHVAADAIGSHSGRATAADGQGKGGHQGQEGGRRVEVHGDGYRPSLLLHLHRPLLRGNSRRLPTSALLAALRRAVEVAFKKPRFLGFLKKPKNPKVQILGFLGFLFLKIVIVFSITY